MPDDYEKDENDHNLWIACVPTLMTPPMHILVKRLADDRELRGYSVCWRIKKVCILRLSSKSHEFLVRHCSFPEKVSHYC